MSLLSLLQTLDKTHLNKPVAGCVDIWEGTAFLGSPGCPIKYMLSATSTLGHGLISPTPWAWYPQSEWSQET